MKKSLALTLIGLITCIQFDPLVADIKVEYLNESRVPLANPHDIKLGPDKKYLYVADVGNSRIAILDPATLTLLAEFGSDHQSGTHDIDFDIRGHAYVADTHNNRVAVYRLDGFEATLIGELGVDIRGPEGVLAHPNGRIYIGGAWSHDLHAYAQGKVVARLTGLSSPHDVELTPDGDIWLSDSGNNRMLLLSPDLTIQRELSGSPYDFNGVRYQDILSDGTIIAADKNNHQVKFITEAGELALILGTGRPGKGEQEFTTPEGVETDDEVLWISDSGNNRIVRYRISFD